MKQLAASLAAVLVLTGITIAAQQNPQQAAAGQDQQQPAATFKSAVDLVAVDVNIIDKTGRPVSGLEAADFTLLVDGKPRTVASAEYIPAVRDVDPSSERPTYYSTNAASAGGRLIMIVVDQGNIGAGRGKLVMDGVARFLSTLSPADRVGLVAIPGAGPQIDFTSNHAAVRSLLPRLIGQAMPLGADHHVGLSEAMRIRDGDQLTMQNVLDRECPGFRTEAEIQLCRNDITDQANSIYHELRDRTGNSITALRYLMDRMALTPSPKTIVFLSEGLVIDRDFALLTWLGPAAAKAQAVIYVMQIDAPMFDATAKRVSATRAEDMRLEEDGLGFMAGLTRGTVMRVIGDPDRVFGRLGLEISGYYLLSFAPDPGERDGKMHKIKVEVPGRKGVEIRSRSEFVIEPKRVMTDEETLAETLRAPLVSSDISLKATAYTMRDDASGKLRVLMAAEIDRSLNPSGRVSLGYTLVDARGRLVASQFLPEVTTPVVAASRTQSFMGSALADAAGVYTLKIAVVDDTGRRGSVEHTFHAQLASAGQVRVTDLLIAENTGTVSAGGLAPAVAANFTAEMLHAYVELYSDAPDVLKRTTVVMEVAENEDGRALDSSAAQVLAPKDSVTRRTAEAAVPIALLPPGDYVARAVVSIDGRPAGKVARPFHIARPRPVITAPGEGAASVSRGRTPIPFTSRIDAFEQSAVLAPQVVGFFLDRMNVGRAGASAAGPAMDEARAGRFDEAVAALKDAGNDQLAAAFLGGLALYAKGAFEPARQKFAEALRIDSEFFPAAFYIGSCYAAAGQDRNAVGAWQTSLVTESDAPFIYTLLGDALLRLRDIEPAVDILEEARTMWPDNEQVQLRYGTALSLAGRRAEAMLALEPYLSKHPEDHERYFIALRTIYEARAEGSAIKSPEEDRAMFERYYAAYSAAKGPHQAMVDQWKKFVEKK